MNIIENRLLIDNYYTDKIVEIDIECETRIIKEHNDHSQNDTSGASIALSSVVTLLNNTRSKFIDAIMEAKNNNLQNYNIINKTIFFLSSKFTLIILDTYTTPDVVNRIIKEEPNIPEYEIIRNLRVDAYSLCTRELMNSNNNKEFYRFIHTLYYKSKIANDDIIKYFDKLDCLVWECEDLVELNNLTNLKELYINRNTTVFFEYIYKLTNLTILNISLCKLDYLEDEIGNLINLRVLDCSATFIDKLPDSLFNLYNLKHLNISYNYISHISDNINKLLNLETLIMNSNNITSVPDTLPKLINLNISSNILISLDNIVKSVNLKYLNISYIKISELPNDIYQLINLEELHANSNKIVSIPSSISKMTKLKILDISYNLIKELPDEIGDLNNMISLIIKGNQISILPNRLNRIINLVII